MEEKRSEQIFYLAPLEGITGYVYRNAYCRYFPDTVRSYTPFVANKGMNSREREDVLPEHNKGHEVIPQILANHSDVFLQLAKILADYGYPEVNLNLGCPSKTVSAGKRGAGALENLTVLRSFLDEIFPACPVPISIKCRVGTIDEDEWPAILDLLNDYPVKELIIHPRLLADFYRGIPRLDCYTYAMDHSKAPVCYNGDIHNLGDYRVLLAQIPNPGPVMLGRGILKDPCLAGRLAGKEAVKTALLEEFMEEILEGHQRRLSGDQPTLYKMKEIWSYFCESFENCDKYMKKIRKSRTVEEYRVCVKALFRDCPRIDFAGNERPENLSGLTDRKPEEVKLC